MRLFDKTRDKLRAVVSVIRARLPRTRRGRILLYSAAGVAAIVATGGLTVAIWSGYPSFCRSCHIIEPHYQSWASSKHAKEGVGCLECHFEPGIGPYIAGKVNGLVEVMKYVVGAYPTKLRSAVPDLNCLREGCHSTEELAAEAVEFGEASFAHDEHLEPVRGVRLRCASCHSTSLHSENETVSTRVCFTCHFAPERAKETDEEREVRERQGECDKCHETPKEVIVLAGATFDHGKYAASGRECSRCHAHVTRGDGRVLEDRCHSCHNKGLGHLDRLAETEFLHEDHVTEHQVACFECHADIRHGKKAIAGLVDVGCGSCHASLHPDIRKLYRGTGGKGVEDLPDPMLAAGVGCTGCHAEQDKKCSSCHPVQAAVYFGKVADDPRSEPSGMAEEKVACEACHKGISIGHSRDKLRQLCVECHKKKAYGRTLDEWQEGIREAQEELQELLSKAEGIRGKAKLSQEEAERLRRACAAAGRAVDLVSRDGSFGAHNLDHLDTVLSDAFDELETAVRKARK